MVRAMEGTMRLMEFGLLFAALPCCSYVFINLGTSMRSESCPFGDESKQHVRDSNTLLGALIVKNRYQSGLY